MQTLFKALLAIVLFISSILAFAGEPDLAPASPPPSMERNGVYVDIAAGYAFVDWSDFGIGSFNGYNPFSGAINSNADGGFSFGFDVGYQINNIIGLEAGWYYLPEVKGNSNIARVTPYLSLNSWLIYLALKLMVPFNDRFSIFGKIGPAYRCLGWDGNAIGFPGFGDRHADYFSGLFGAGFQYYFNNNFSVSVQYLYMLDNTSGAQIPDRAPGANIIVGTVAYIFPVYS